MIGKRLVVNTLSLRTARARYEIGDRTTIERRVEREQDAFRSISTEQLLRASRELEFNIKGGLSLEKGATKAFALVREATRRVRGIEHYGVQLLAGAHLIRRCIVEMDTGEGKTLTALLPLFLYSLQGRGVLLATANDYLAARDAEGAGEILKLLGKSVGVVTAGMDGRQRRAAYHCDITYGTANEFGFDIIRDRGARRAGDEATCVGRGFQHSLIVDEADSLLIDEATTPMVIASPAPEIKPHVRAAYQWASRHAPTAREGVDYRFDEKQEKVTLTPQGNRWALRIPLDRRMTQISRIDCVEHLERAIKVHRNFHRDQQYVIQNDEVILVDEHTGRFGLGREWHDGIQQAVQAKEGLKITMPSGQMGRMTLQSMFLAFKHLSGMTGTAKQATNEFSKVYKLYFYRVPPHRKNLRAALPDRFFKTEDEKFHAIAEETQTMVQRGRCVLIGTRSIEASVRLSEVLNEQNIKHRILNASQSEQEADLVSQAGQPGSVMVATSMAGRGTDIELADSVRKAGGLHVILSELHDSPRIDRQLIGRSARQGDPGSYRRMLAATDEIANVAKGMQRTHNAIGKSISALYNAQATVSARREAQRRGMFHQEKRRLKELLQGGFDPLLDYVG